MTRIGDLAGVGFAIAASLLLGTLVAARITLPERLAAAITAIGGGVLLAAVAFELVPKPLEWPAVRSRPVGLAGTIPFSGGTP